MALFLDGIGNILEYFFGSGDSEDDYLSPPERSGKRKVREELQRPSQSYKARRYSTPRSYAEYSAYNRDSYEESDLSEEPQYLARGMHSETDTDQSSLREYNPENFLKHRNSLEKNRARAQSLHRNPSTRQDSVHDNPVINRRRSSSAQRASPERVRRGRLNFFGQIGSGVSDVAKSVVSTIAGTEADEPNESNEDEEPELTERRIQKQLSRNFPVEDEDSDAQLSEGALGRKYWSKTPLKSQRSERARPASVKAALPATRSSKNAGLSVNNTTNKTYNPKGNRYPDIMGIPKPSIQRPSTTRPTESLPKTIRPLPETARSLPKTTGKSQKIPTPITKPRIVENLDRSDSQGEARPHLKEWSTKPSKRVREIMKAHPTKYPQKIIEEIQEPGYTIRDVEVRDMLWQIMDMTERLAKNFFSSPLSNTPLPAGQMKVYLKEMYKLFDPTTAQIIGCIATGGPRGEEGWDDLFTDSQKHRALVCGIIGNVLVEQVFKHPCFGADEATIDRLVSSQTVLKDDDGFARKWSQATILQPLLFPEGSTLLQPPENFTAHVEAIVHALLTHLLPIYTLPVSRHKLRDSILLPGSKLPNGRALLERFEVIGGANQFDGLFENLTTLVTTAGLLALNMASDPHTVYHHVPVFKEDRFDHNKHEAFNHRRMELTHPRQETTKWPASTTDAEKQRAQGDEALNQILLMDGLTAYRKGGWEDWATSRPYWDDFHGAWKGRVYARPEDKDDGFRGRILTPGWVYCRWGRARRFGKDGEAAAKEEHGAANWVEPGFVEFRDVLENAKKERGTKTAKRKGKEPKEGAARYTY